MKIRKLFTLEEGLFNRFKDKVGHYNMSKTINAMMGKYDRDSKFRNDIKKQVDE